MPLQPAIKELGDRVYIVAPVQVMGAEPEAEERSAWQFGEEIAAWKVPAAVQGAAPNPKLMWMRGQYVEADNANSNGDQWTAGELALKALTPVFMPVTVMHDFTSSVGLIADTKLLVPNKDNVPRARIETVLAVWKHRYPQIAEEIEHNAREGMLMQSMECIAPHYECSACGTRYERLPEGAERENWCAHLTGSDGSKAARILGGVTFTGTGLIFGSRGARGAYPEAQLEVETLAEAHERWHHDSRANKTRRTSVPKIEVEQSDYEAKVSAAAKVPELTATAAKVPDLEARLADAEKKVETAEAEKVKAEGERDTEKKRADEAEEKANQSALRDERFEKLGKGFIARLDKAPTTKTRLTEQAGSLSEDDWKARLTELAEAFGVKADDDKVPEGNGGGGNDDEKEESADVKNGLFSEEQVAAAGVGSGSGSATAAKPTERKAVIGGLAKGFGRRPGEKAKK